MSIKIMSEAWEHAPVDQGTLLVLLALADAAEDSSRTCYPGIKESLAPKTRLSQRQVIRCLQDLADLGVIKVRRGASPLKTNLYKIAPVADWHTSGSDTHVTSEVTSVTARSDIMSPGEAEAEVTSATARSDTHVTSEVTPMSPKPSVTSVIEPSVAREAQNTPLFDLHQQDRDPIKKNDDGFDAFWNLFPKKEGKIDAHKAWSRAIKIALPSRITEGARRYAVAMAGSEKKFIKHPQGWLNGQRWEDPDLWTEAAPSQEPWRGQVYR